MTAAQSVLLIVADDVQPSDIHALRHLHAPPILSETPWHTLEHTAAGCRWAVKPKACVHLATESTFARCCCSGSSRPVLSNHTLATCLHVPLLGVDAEGLPTPSLDRLIEEGVAVSRAYSPQCASTTRIADHDSSNCPNEAATSNVCRQCALRAGTCRPAHRNDGL